MRIKKKANIQVPSGTAILISVSTNTFPLAGTTVSFAAYISYPAANALPLVGNLAFSDSFLIRSGGAASTGTTAGTEVGALIFVGVGGITVGVLGVKELDVGEAGLGFNLFGKGDVGDWGLVDIWFSGWCWEGKREGEFAFKTRLSGVWI